MYVKIHFKSGLGNKIFTGQEATPVVGTDPEHNIRDLFESIKREDFPTWSTYIQVMGTKDAETYRWNIFDMTKV
jgi:catalase